MSDSPSTKLAVIVHADVVGSTALVRRNEAIADQRIQDAFLRFAQEIANHGGTAHEVRGDALVAEFAKASDAVVASLDFQAGNTSHNQQLPDEFRPAIRVGIAMGEIVINEGRMTGAGVVLAQRLEQLAEPGGVCIQSAVRETLPERLSLDFIELGDQRVKGFDNPVKVYAVRQSPVDAGHSGLTDRADIAAPWRADRASIAVLAFANMSGDTEQEFFCDGITEDIITELSRFPVFSVIARQSSFAFKGEKIDIKEIGEKLGVNYVIEGSVRRAGDRIRVTAQLIHADSGKHVWAERYDRKLEDIFDVQDEVTRAVVATVAAQLGKEVSDNVGRKHPASVKSYEFFLRGNRHYYRFNPADNLEASALFEKAIQIDPQFARAYAGLANTYTTDHFLGWRRRANALQHGREAAEAALEIDSGDALARLILAWVLIGERRWEEAERELDRALSPRPGDADILAEAGLVATNVGRADVGIALLEEAISLNPLFPESYRRWLGLGYHRVRRYREAVIALRAALLEGWAYGALAASLARLGELDQAHEALKMFVAERRKTLESAGVEATTTADLLGNYKDNFRYEEDWEHLLEGLRLAGFGQSNV